MKRLILALLALVGLLVLLWQGRTLLVRLLPITHQGEVMRIKTFHKGRPTAGQDRDTRQTVQFAILFTDGFDCEGYDTSFAAVEPGDTIELRAYPDVAGWPLLDPEWWECDEAQLVRVVTPHP